jgi:hypothetical protein
MMTTFRYSHEQPASTELFVGSFEPRTNISCIAIGGVIEEADTTEFPHHRRSSMDTNPGDAERDTTIICLPVGIYLLVGAIAGHGR